MSAPSLAPCARKAAPGLPSAVGLRDRDVRLQTLKTLIGDLAHGINNSLAPLAGYVTLLAEEMKPGIPGQPLLAKIQKVLHKSELSLAALLQATHPERHFTPRPTRFDELLQRTTETWLKSLPDHSRITVQWEVAPCSCHLDEAQWTCALQHLLNNAQTATAGTGAVEISLQARELSAEQAMSLGIVERSVAELRVGDSGCGMTEEVREHACDPLFSTQGHGLSKGLGLTLLHSVVRLHDGQLAMESEPDAGTVVRVWLPRLG